MSKLMDEWWDLVTQKGINNETGTYMYIDDEEGISTTQPQPTKELGQIHLTCKNEHKFTYTQ
jgi:hypothetical protein